MKKLVLFGMLLNLFSAATMAAEFSNKLTFKKVRISSDYEKRTLFWRKSYDCEDFKGTYDKSTVLFTAEATGGEGRVTHTLIYMIGNAYETKELKTEQFHVRKKGKKETFKIKLPALKNNVPFANQVLTLISEDSKGRKAQTTFKFTVSRPVVLAPATGARAQELNCYHRYPAFESVTGVLSNGSSTLSSLEIKQGIQRLWESRRGHNWGVYLSPQLQLGVFNLALSLNYQYFKETSKQTVETVDVVSGYHLNPGDYLQIYTQPTRYVHAYDATMVNACGKTEKKEAAYMFQWWGYAYHVKPVDPFDRNATVDLNLVGAVPMNTCPADWTDSELTGNFIGFN